MDPSDFTCVSEYTPTRSYPDAMSDAQKSARPLTRRCAHGHFPARALLQLRCLSSAAVIRRRATNRCVSQAHRRPCARATNLPSGCASGTRTVITNRLPLACRLHGASRTCWSNGRRALITSSTSCAHGMRTSCSSPHPPSLYLRLLQLDNTLVCCLGRRSFLLGARGLANTSPPRSHCRRAIGVVSVAMSVAVVATAVAPLVMVAVVWLWWCMPPSIVMPHAAMCQVQ